MDDTSSEEHRLRATAMLEDPNHHDLVHRVVSALAMAAAGMEARSKLGQGEH
jgi:hypothetical protein